MKTNALAKYQNYSPSIYGEVNNIFDRLFDSFWADPSFLTSRNWRPTWDREDNDNYYIDIELPGIKKEELTVSTKNSVLKITASNSRYNYSREFQHEGMDLEKVTCKLEDGILKLTVPKLAGVKERLIEIT